MIGRPLWAGARVCSLVMAVSAGVAWALQPHLVFEWPRTIALVASSFTTSMDGIKDFWTRRFLALGLASHVGLLAEVSSGVVLAALHICSWAHLLYHDFSHYMNNCTYIL